MTRTKETQGVDTRPSPIYICIVVLHLIPETHGRLPVWTCQLVRAQLSKVRTSPGGKESQFAQAVMLKREREGGRGEEHYEGKEGSGQALFRHREVSSLVATLFRNVQVTVPSFPPQPRKKEERGSRLDPTSRRRGERRGGGK